MSRGQSPVHVQVEPWPGLGLARVDPADDLLDVRLGDLQVDQAVVAATRAVSSAAEPRKRSHWRGPSTFSTRAPSTSSGGAGSSRSTISVRSVAVALLQVGRCAPS